MKLRKFVASGLVAGTIIATAPSAFGVDPTDIIVTAGSLAITTAPTVANFAGITLSGVAQTTTAAMDSFQINDARGSGAGWNVTVQGTQMSEHNGTIYVVSGKTLATSSLTLAALTVAANGTSSTSPTIVAGPYTVDAGSAVKITTAATNAGMGKYDYSAGTFTLSVPSSAFAKTYRSDVTVSLVSGP
ncbi:MAG: WxL domain-containing protein [Actinomycetota bacterium]